MADAAAGSLKIGGATEIVATQIPRPHGTSQEMAELSQLERDASQNHNIRRVAAYGALACAAALYAAGLYAVAHIVGLVSEVHRFTPEMWHIATIVVAALFTVPTVLILAVLRATSKAAQPRGHAGEAIHEWLGRTVVDAVEKLTGKG